MPSEFIVFALLESLCPTKLSRFNLIATYDYPNDELHLIKSNSGRLIPDGSTEISEYFFKRNVLWPDDILYVVQYNKCFVYQKSKK